MNKIKCIIVDDEPLAIELLADYVARCGFLELVASFGSPVEALTFARSGNADLIFLDIQMQELDGLHFMRLLGGRCRAILITAYPDYALKGYELDVLDYLLKPVLFERFLQAVQKYPAASAASAPAPANSGSPDQALFIKSGTRIFRLKFRDILYIEGRREYAAIHTGHEVVLSKQRLSRIETLLRGHAFIRVHKSYIVSLDAIDAIEHNRIFIREKTLPVGDVYRAAFFHLLGRDHLL